MPYDGRSIANIILDEADRNGINLSNLALQKVIFFCHAWHLVEFDEPLVSSRFEAWQHGPVLQYLYRQFKQHDRSSITSRATRLDPQSGKTYTASDDVPDGTLKLISEVVNFYGRLEPWHLVDLSHEKGGPWDVVWNHTTRVNPGMKISNDEILKYYSSVDPIHKVH